MTSIAASSYAQGSSGCRSNSDDHNVVLCIIESSSTSTTVNLIPAEDRLRSESDEMRQKEIGRIS